jgi:hypothetical protein
MRGSGQAAPGVERASVTGKAQARGGGVRLRPRAFCFYPPEIGKKSQKPLLEEIGRSTQGLTLCISWGLN